MKGSAQINGAARNIQPHKSTVPRGIKGATQINGAARVINGAAQIKGAMRNQEYTIQLCRA
jgi:hypothetical protein